MSGPQEEVFAPVAEFLLDKLDIESSFGADNAAANEPAPRYVWVPRTGAPIASLNDREGTDLGSVQWTFEVFCFGETFDGAFGMVGQLLTAVRDVVKGASVAFGGADATPIESNHDGVLITVSLLVTLPLWADEFDDETDLATIEEVALDDSDGVDPDGILTAPKS